MGLTFHNIHIRSFLCFSLLLVLFSSCSIVNFTTVKNPPANKAFVFDNKIELKGNISKDEKKRLSEELINYWDDSLKVPKIQQFGVFYKIKNPPVFDSANITRTVALMNAYLNSQGYYYATYADSVKIDTVKEQIRAKINMRIQVGKNITIDSVSFALGDSTLQQLTKEKENSTLLKKGVPYTKGLISSELDRLVGLYRQNGYFLFTRDDIFAEADTTDPRLLELTLDPFKQAQLIAEAAKARRENPTWDITIFNRPITDSNRLKRYYIGQLYYYPETKMSDIPDSLLKRTDFLETHRRNMTIRYKKGLFNYRPLREHTFLRNGTLYNENDYFKSINTLGQIGAWQQVDARPVIRGKDSLDVYFFLAPAIKQNFTVDLEGSRNTADFGLGNLWGISTNFAYNNKNVWKSAVQSLTTLRTGVELNLLTSDKSRLLQTFLVNVGHTYAFPKLIVPFKNWRALNRLDNKKTLFSINGSYVDRRDFYKLRSLVTSWGYEWKKGNNTWLYKPLNVELYSIDTLDGLRRLFDSIPFLRSSFNSGRVISQSLSLVRNFINSNNPNRSHYMRIGLEEAGGLFSLFGGVRNQIYRYVKLEAEYRESIKMRKTELAFRAFAGVGYNYGNDTLRDRTLPFFKQFSAGGPYSMRAWGLRQLGLGSSKQSEASASANSYRDRFGDFQLEANIEYRYPLGTIAGVKIGSALFADIGNIWNLKSNNVDPEAKFSFKNLGRDLAIGVGTGVRVDFSYFLIRLDLAYKVKDPARQYNNGWMDQFQWTENRANGLKIPNYALQLGIGLPF
ncbi:MAG: BamA/TamA family outer membrane protein [Chitinophagaceae bacterium]|nr:BamA/TamA family outer membrane protein [Chitinophagaceae bacterium]MCA6452807.1 BamA/TamA family outer membrane protein [Chitinophagaceae bacterium]MCA6456729.1 BamA/TamA family outer membrane protein [Chitinophagaceae bacterium]MCA6459485.1 BamA/TamA family outer membrane protein [Chitinophagaceae bacterium]MCA6464711.1 BamA/TamA family outer membrane protein [Chitinophagaceae bacterium]